MGVENGTEFGEESVAILSGRVDADALVQLHFCEHTRAMQGISQSMRRMGESWSESMSWSPEPEQQRGDLRDELQRSLRWSGAAASTTGAADASFARGSCRFCAACGAHGCSSPCPSPSPAP